MYQQPKIFNPVRAWGDNNSMVNGARMSAKPKQGAPFMNPQQ